MLLFISLISRADGITVWDGSAFHVTWTGPGRLQGRFPDVTGHPTTHHTPAGHPLLRVSSENRQTGVGAGHRLLPRPTHRDRALPSAPETWPRPGVLGPAARPQQSGWNTSPQAACSPPGLGPRRLRRPRHPGAHQASFRSGLSGNDGERSCSQPSREVIWNTATSATALAGAHTDPIMTTAWGACDPHSKGPGLNPRRGRLTSALTTKARNLGVSSKELSGRLHQKDPAK